MNKLFFFKVFLLPSSTYLILFTTVILSYYFKKEFLLSSLKIISVSILINVYLKLFYMVPALHGHNGYSFPSGHGQLACIFWVWLFINFPKKINLMIIISMLIGHAFSLKFFGHHRIIDTYASYLFALIIIWIYLKLLCTSKNNYALGTLSNMFVIILPLFYVTDIYLLPYQYWLASLFLLMEICFCLYMKKNLIAK